MYFMTLKTPYAGYICKHNRRKKEFVLNPVKDELIVRVKAGTQIVALDNDYKVLSQNGDVIHPYGHFFRTVTTIDPYHIILDVG